MARLALVAVLVFLTACRGSSSGPLAMSPSSQQNAGVTTAATAASGSIRSLADPVSSRPVFTIPENTRLEVRLNEALDTRRNRTGDPFSAVLEAPVVSGDRVILPRGTLFHGHILTAFSSGRLKGRAALSLALDAFDLSGERYDIDTTTNRRISGRHRKRNWTLIGGGAGFGAALGAIAGGGTGALIGAGAGTAAGLTGAAITGKKQVSLPAETLLTFTLRRSVTLSSRRPLPSPE